MIAISKIVCRYTLLRMLDFTASARTDSLGLAWGLDTIDKERGASPEEGDAGSDDGYDYVYKCENCSVVQLGPFHHVQLWLHICSARAS